jgi:hypothetical protein
MRRTSLLASAAALLLWTAACRTTDEGTNDATVKDFNQTEQSGLAIQTAIYFSDGQSVFRAFCPGSVPAQGNFRQACPQVTHNTSVANFKTNIRANYRAQFGSFGNQEETALNQFLALLANPNVTGGAGNLGPISMRFLPFMLAAVTVENGQPAPDPDPNGDPTTPIPPPSAGQLVGPLTVSIPRGAFSSELRVDFTSAVALTRVRAELSQGCTFNTSAVVAGLGGLQGRKSFNPLETGRVSRWVLPQAVQPQRLFITFAGNAGNCAFSLFDESNAPVDDGPRVTTVLAIFSTQGFGGFLQPDQTHTFGFYAKFDRVTRQVLDHVPISWLPVLTTAQGRPAKRVRNQLGQDTLQDISNTNDKFVVGPIETLGGVVRMGFDFSMDATMAPIRANGTRITTHGLFRATDDTFEKAKQWRDELNANARNFLATGRLGSRFRYVADDRNNFPRGCVNPKPDALNCFHAFTALSDRCFNFGILSGNSVTVEIVKLFKEFGVITQQPITTDGPTIEGILNQVIAREQSTGAFNRP